MNTAKLSILVVDDNQKHIDAAIKQLNGHNVTTVTSFSEARFALNERTAVTTDLKDLNRRGDDMGIRKDLWISSGLQKTEDDPERDESEYTRLSKEVEESRARKITRLLGKKYDVVLTDLLLPASAECLGEPEKYFGQEMPLGTLIVFYALQLGVKKIAIVTDSNHHDHPAAAAIDMLRTLQLGDTRVDFLSDTTGEAMIWTMTETGEKVRVKNWAKALGKLLR